MQVVWCLQQLLQVPAVNLCVLTQGLLPQRFYSARVNVSRFVNVMWLQAISELRVKAGKGPYPPAAALYSTQTSLAEGHDSLPPTPFTAIGRTGAVQALMWGK